MRLQSNLGWAKRIGVGRGMDLGESVLRKKWNAVLNEEATCPSWIESKDRVPNAFFR
jgi:hypothetical protein